MVTLVPKHVLRLLRQRLRFLETEHGFKVVAQSATYLFCHLTYRKGSTDLTVGWDLREGEVTADFCP